MYTVANRPKKKSECNKKRCEANWNGLYSREQWAVTAPPTGIEGSSNSTIDETQADTDGEYIKPAKAHIFQNRYSQDSKSCHRDVSNSWLSPEKRRARQFGFQVSEYATHQDLAPAGAFSYFAL
jgi:hypothetical protein